MGSALKIHSKKLKFSGQCYWINIQTVCQGLHLLALKKQDKIGSFVIQ